MPDLHSVVLYLFVFCQFQIGQKYFLYLFLWNLLLVNLIYPQIFYLMTRGFTKEEAVGIILKSFVDPIVKKLPMEYAIELNRMLELAME